MQKQEVLDVQVKACRRPVRFKAGSELSSKVNFVSLDVDHSMDEDQECVQLNLKLVASADVADCDGEI